MKNNLKRYKGKKSNISSSIHLCVDPKNFTWTKTKPKEFWNGKCLRLFIQRYSWHLAQFCNVIIQGIIIFFAMQNPSRLSISGCVLKPEGLRGVSKQVICTFSFYWIDVGWGKMWLQLSRYNAKRSRNVGHSIKL